MEHTIITITERDYQELINAVPQDAYFIDDETGDLTLTDLDWVTFKLEALDGDDEVSE
jgi:hypothetical protein